MITFFDFLNVYDELIVRLFLLWAPYSFRSTQLFGQDSVSTTCYLSFKYNNPLKPTMPPSKFITHQGIDQHRRHCIFNASAI